MTAGRAIAIAAGVLLAIAAAGAGADAEAADEVVKLPGTRTVLAIPAGWQQVEIAGLVAAYRSDAGAHLAVTRAQVPNPDAWRARTRDAYADQIAAGALRGLVRVARKLGDANGIPVLDLEARRDDGATLVVRVLLFRTYALALAIEVPRGGAIAEARAIAAGFTPPAEPK